MADILEVTFTWSAGASLEWDDTLTLSISKEQLMLRDPKGTSLIAAKKEFTGAARFSIATDGPGEDECMCAAPSATL